MIDFYYLNCVVYICNLLRIIFCCVFKYMFIIDCLINVL